MKTPKFGKIFALLIAASAALIATAHPQAARTVMVNSNSGVLLFPTNLWSANAANARSGLSLGSAATNPASAFQPSSAVLSNLASSNGFSLTNLNASNITGIIPASNISTIPFSNVSGTLAIASGGTGATNAAAARTNLGLGSTNEVSFDDIQINEFGEEPVFVKNESGFIHLAVGTNENSVLSLSDTVATLAVYLDFNNSTNAATTRTNFGLGWPALTNTNSSVGLIGFTTNGNIVIANTNTNVITITNPIILSTDSIYSPSAATIGTSGNFEIRTGTNTNTWGVSYDGANYFSAFSYNGSQLIRLTSSNINYSVPVIFATNTASAQTRTNLGLGWSALTNTNAANFRTAIGLGETNAVTNGSLSITSLVIPIYAGGSVVGSNTISATSSIVEFKNFGTLALSVGMDDVIFNGNITNGKGITVGTDATLGQYYGISFASGNIGGAAITRTNLGLGSTWLTNTNVASFRSDIGLGSAATNLASAFQPSSAVLSNLANNNGASLTNINVSNLGTISVVNGGTGATNAATARTNLGLGATNSVTFNILTATSSVSTPDLSGDNITVEGAIYFTEALTNVGVTRTNLGLGWSALTNSNAGTGLVSVNTNGEVVSPTNFWQVAPIQTLVQSIIPVTNSTNSATNARNLYVYSLATNIINVTNTITLPTNTSVFDGDEVTVIHRGGSNSVTAVRQLGSTNNLISLNSYDEAVKFIEDGNWDFYHNISFTEAIRFSGTNAALHAAQSRTNLGLGNTNSVEFGVVTVGSELEIIEGAVIEIRESAGIVFGGDNYLTNCPPIYFSSGFPIGDSAGITRTNLGIPLAALTSTNNAKFQEAIFATNAAPTNAANFGDHAAWMGVSIVTNGVTNVFRIPLYK